MALLPPARKMIRSGFGPGTANPRLAAISQFLSYAGVGLPYTRTIDAKAKLVDHSRNGTPREMQPGRCYLLDGVADKITASTVGDVRHVSMRVKLLATDQELLTLQNTAATAVTVVGGVLTFGGSLAGSNIYVDGVSKTPAEAGALLNDLEWHRLDFDLAAVSASSLVIGSDGSGFGNFYLHDFRMYGDTLTASEVAAINNLTLGVAALGPSDAIVWYKCEPHYGSLVVDASGNGKHGTLTAAALSTAINSTVNDQYSFINEVGGTPTVARFDAGTSSPAWTAAIISQESFTGVFKVSLTVTHVALSGENWICMTDKSDAAYPTAIYQHGYPISWHVTPTYARVIYNGLQKYTTGAAPTVGDKLTIERLSDNTVEWRRNGALVHSESSDTKTYRHVQTNTITGRVMFPVDFEVSGAYTPLTMYRIGSQAQNALILPPSYWPRDESDTANDTEGNTLQHSGKCPHDWMIFSPCVTLDGVADTLLVPDDDVFTFGDGATDGPFSIVALVNLAATVGEPICDKYLTTGEREWVFGVSSNQLRFWALDESASAWRGRTAPFTTTGSWVWVAGTYSGNGATTGFKIYADGVQIDDANFTGGATYTAMEPGSDAVGIGRANGGIAGPLQGKIASLAIYSVEKSQSQIQSIQNGSVDDDNLVERWGFSEIAGRVVHGKNGNHAVATFASESAAWANQQNKKDSAVGNGFSPASYFSAAEYYSSSPMEALLEGQTKVSFGCWIWSDSTTIRGFFFSQLNGSHDIQVYRQANGTVFVELGNGANSYAQSAAAAIANNRWVHLSVVYDGAGATNADRLKIYIDGAAIAPTYTGTIPASLSATLGPLEWGRVPSFGLAGLLADWTVDIGAAWTAATVAAHQAGSIPVSAYYWPWGDNKETQQGVVDATATGTPDRVIVPRGILPTTYGPGVLPIRHSLNLSGNEANSPYAQQLAAILADLDYDQGDDDEADSLFVRVTANGDDRFNVAVPPATGTAKQALLDWTA